MQSTSQQPQNLIKTDRWIRLTRLLDVISFLLFFVMVFLVAVLDLGVGSAELVWLTWAPILFAGAGFVLCQPGRQLRLRGLTRQPSLRASVRALTMVAACFYVHLQHLQDRQNQIEGHTWAAIGVLMALLSVLLVDARIIDRPAASAKK